jgi:protein O-mannosyl-transferase
MRTARKNRTSISATPHSSDPFWLRFLDPLGLALILLLILVAYWPARYGPLLLDDDINITRPDLQSTHGLYRIWFDPTSTAQYYPLVHTAFWIEHRLWGDEVLGYHLATLAWHMLATVLLYAVVRKLEIPGALLAAALFALHPVMVESVAWMAEQKNTLSAVFYLAALWQYLNFNESRAAPRYILALFLFALALCTKTSTAPLPATVLLILWCKKGRISWRNDVWPLVPFFVLGIAAGLTTSWVERHVSGTEGVEFELSPLQRFLLAGRIVWFYLAKLFWPADVAFIYPRWTIDPAEWWQWLFPLAAIATTLALLAIHRRTRAPLAAWLLFCVMLSPAIGFFNISYFAISFVADHFQYLASLGVIVFVAGGTVRAAESFDPPWRQLAISLCLLSVGLLSALSRHQAHFFADAVAYNQKTIDRNPNCWLAHTNLANALIDRGKSDEAIKHLQTAIQIESDPSLAQITVNLRSDLLNTRAEQLILNNRLREAVDDLKQAVQLDPANVDAHYNLGNVLMQLNRFPEAISVFETALKLHPSDSRTHNNLGLTLSKAGRTNDAMKHWQEAIRIQPDNIEARNNLGAALLALGKPQEAIEQFRSAVASQPHEVRSLSNLANTLADAGYRDEAIQHFEKALSLDPNSAKAHTGLAIVLQQIGRNSEAVEHYREAVRIQPDFIEVYAKLAQTFATMNRSNDAIAAAEKGIQAARHTGNEILAGKIEDWLSHYRTELRRAPEHP